MTLAARRALIAAMEYVCGLVDRLPDWTWHIPGLHRLGCGSRNGLALRASRLDERWGTGVWTAPR